jgi:uncharacterized RDD family membrane protein YckC
MSDTSQGEGWWRASDEKWYPPQEASPPAPLTQTIPAPQTAPAPAGGVGLPDGVTSANPWIRLGSYLLESILGVVTLGIGWLIWASMTAGDGQTPAKRLLGLRVIDSSSIRPVGMGKMFWMRGIVGGMLAQLATIFTLGIILFMPFWDKRNQNVWDKVSSTYVVSDPNDAWGTKPNLVP